jgi:hypothetical protein
MCERNIKPGRAGAISVISNPARPDLCDPMATCVLVTIVGTLSAKDSSGFAAAMVGAVCGTVGGFVPADFRSDPMAARRLLHATTATELGVTEHRPGVEPLLE